MNPMASFLPKNLFLFMLPDRVLALRYGLGLTGKSLLRESRSFQLGGPQDWGEVLGRVAREYRPSPDDTWFLGLPLRLFTAVSFTLPKAAGQNLDQAVHYGLMSQVPFDLSQAYTHYVHRDRGEHLEILATVALRDQLRPYLEAVSSAGITLSVVVPSLALVAAMSGRDGVYASGAGGEAEIMAWRHGRIVYQAYQGEGSGDEESMCRFLARTKTQLDNAPGVPDGPYFFWEWRGEPEAACDALGAEGAWQLDIAEMPGNPVRAAAWLPYQVDLVSPATLKRRRVSLVVQAAALLLLILSLTALPLAKTLGKRHHLKTLENNIRQSRLQTEKISEIRHQNDETIEYLQKVADYVEAQPLVSELLKEITEIMPSDAWLQSFVFSGRKIYVHGRANSATAVLEALENSPLLKEAHFDSQIVKSGNEEVFKIVAGLE
jgi:general secretion pathway protein L